MTEHIPRSKRQRIVDEDVNSLSNDELLKKCQEQQMRIEILETKLNNDADDDNSNEKSRCTGETSRRENVLMMRLANKEQEVQEYMAQINHSKKVQEDAALLSLQQTNLDPGINLLFGKMREELQQTKDNLEQAQSELSAWKFTPDSQNGKKLISRCRTLIAENQELGRQLSEGKTAHLEAELALQKKYTEELKASQDEMNEFVIQLDEEVEDMQNTIQVLQQQLLTAKADNEEYRKILDAYKSEFELTSDDTDQLIDNQPDGEYTDDDDDCNTSTVSDDNAGKYSGAVLDKGDYKQNPDLFLNSDEASVNSSKSDGNYSESDSDKELDRAPREAINTEINRSPDTSNSLDDNGRTHSNSATPTRDDFDDDDANFSESVSKTLDERTYCSNKNDNGTFAAQSDKEDSISPERIRNDSGDDVMARITIPIDNADKLVYNKKKRKKSLSENNEKLATKKFAQLNSLSENEESNSHKRVNLNSESESDLESEKVVPAERKCTPQKTINRVADTAVCEDQDTLLAQCNRLLAQALPGTVTDQDVLADLSLQISAFTKANHDNLDLHSLELVQKTIKRLLSPSSNSPSPPCKELPVTTSRRTSSFRNHSHDVAASQNGTEEKSD